MTRVRRTIAIALLALAGAWLLGGLVLFPDGPIHACASGYCGKQGQPRTLQDFGRYRIWEGGLGFGWPGVMLAAWWLVPRRTASSYDKRKVDVRAVWKRW